jgi:hypothetical protein
VRLAERGDDRREEGHDVRWIAPDPDAPRLAVSKLTRESAHPFGGREQLFGSSAQLLTVGRQPHSTTDAFEQSESEIRFQVAHLLPQRGLGDMQPLGSGGVRPGMRDRHEVLEAPQVHPNRLLPYHD